MITYYKMYGRFGNILYSIYTCYMYCLKNNISFDNIKFNEGGLCNRHRNNYYFDKIKDFFNDELKDKFCIENNEFANQIKRIPLKLFKDTSQLSDVCFVDYSWCREDNKIFVDLFYNKELWNSVLNKSNLDFKNSLGIHIRRTDFLKLGRMTDRKKYVDMILNDSIYEKYYIFTDDTKWCKFFLNVKNNVYFVEDILKNLKIYEYWILMTMCTDIITYPFSSYSGSANRFHNIMKEYYG